VASVIAAASFLFARRSNNHKEQSNMSKRSITKKILVIEGNQAKAATIVRALMDSGYAVQTVDNGENALTTAMAEKPDLIITNIMLPKVSGWDVMDLLKQTSETQDIPVIVLSGLSLDDDKQRAANLGAVDYLVVGEAKARDVVLSVNKHLYDGEPKTRGFFKQTTAIVTGLAIIILGIATSQFLFGHHSSPIHFHSHALPSNYADNRTDFTDSIKSYSDATDVINVHGDANQVSTALSASIASSNKVSDDFLNYLDPQLKDEYRNNLIMGEQEYLQGFNESSSTDTADSPSTKLQTDGIQLEQNWNNWWNSHNTALSNKAFAN
jgi:CheY-like chemotaxis protein